MQRIALRATIVALACILVSLAIGALVIPPLGGTFDQTAFVMCVACPTVIAWPVSFFTNVQKERLAGVHAELKRAHEEMAYAHQQLAATHRKLAEKARRDDMTGMLNRETFFATLEGARRKTDDGTLLIIDADNFKRINDEHGHPTGDDALLKICAALDRAVRDTDILGRIGGEEFGAFLVGAEEREAAKVAERIRLEVEKVEFIAPGGVRLPLTVSIGGSLHRRGTPLSELMREADRRLYQAKRAGRNRVIFADDASAAA